MNSKCLILADTVDLSYFQSIESQFWDQLSLEAKWISRIKLFDLVNVQTNIHMSHFSL